MEVPSTTVGFENGKNLKLIFEENKCIKAGDTYASKIIPIKLYTPLLCTTNILM